MDSRTERNDARRREISEAVADLLLRDGVDASTLKRMAEAAQTSDRMLLHYFDDKNQLLGDSLSLVSERLLQLLSETVSEPQPFAELVEALGPLLRSEHVRPYLRIWLELATQALAGTNPFTTQTNTISAAMERWLIQSIRPEGGVPREELADLALAMIDGCVALDALGLTSVSDAALRGLQKLALQDTRAQLRDQP